MSAGKHGSPRAVPAELAGARLDRALAALSGASRSQAQQWIAAGKVLVDGDIAERPSRALRGGELLAWSAPPPADPRIQGEAGELVLLHLDDELIVVDKPAGLAMHPGAGRSTATLAHRLLGRFPELAAVGGPGRPGIVHRLDKDTSGVVAVARTAAAYEALTRAFAERRVEKRYLAIVHGAPLPPAGRIEQPIGRHAIKRQQMAVRASGRPALTLYRTLATSGAPVRKRSGVKYALLELDLKTGRTHQIRVHMRHIKHPIAGDPTYGSGPSGAPRVALHAWRLAFAHPASGEAMDFRAPLAPDLAAWWQAIAGAAPPAL